MSDRALSVLVHGHSKVGKTTFAATSPYPRLFLDVDHAFFLLDQILIQARVLHSDDRLSANDIEQTTTFLGEIIRVRMSKEHCTIHIESTS